MDGVHNDDNLIHIKKMGNLINITSYGKNFSFSKHDIDYMMYSLDDWIIFTIDVGYQHSNLILDTYVYYNNH